jgi:membrane protease YdiL (CAAX protease family)
VHEADPVVGLVSLSTAVVNALGEEVLWRGLYLEAFPNNPWLGAIYPLLGFTFWHLAPQTILPSRRGRVGFLAGAGIVGACSTWATWRTRSIRAALIPHILTDACGIRVAKYRLGR